VSGTTSSYVARAIDVTFSRPPYIPGVNRHFQGTGTNTLTVSGLRVSVQIEEKGSAVGLNTATARIYGLTQSVMNDLSTLGMIVPFAERNTMQIFAGNQNSQLSSVFVGDVNEAWGDYEDLPNVSFLLHAQTGMVDMIAPVSPLSFPDVFDVADALGTLAGKMGMSFENNNVTGVVLPCSYFPGTALQQARAIANAAGINFAIDNGVMVIFPAGGARAGTTVAIGPDTGMIGYPRFTNFGMVLRTVYNPALRFGGLIKVTSDIKAANGTFVIGALTHTLESRMPNGKWETLVSVLIAGYPGIIT
jgi:hypothetical protein